MIVLIQQQRLKKTNTSDARRVVAVCYKTYYSWLPRLRSYDRRVNDEIICDSVHEIVRRSRKCVVRLKLTRALCAACSKSRTLFRLYYGGLSCLQANTKYIIRFLFFNQRINIFMAFRLPWRTSFTDEVFYSTSRFHSSSSSS